VFSRIFYGPGDWLATKLGARQRRAIIAWLLILAIFPFTPLTYIWRNTIWMIWAISMIAIYLSLGGMLSAETPVEEEDE
jgi:hypothetical protein